MKLDQFILNYGERELEKQKAKDLIWIDSKLQSSLSLT